MSRKLRNVITVVLFLVFVSMFVYGFGSGEAETVLQKAVNICLECIGIG